jgi:hypothetical protein
VPRSAGAPARPRHRRRAVPGRAAVDPGEPGRPGRRHRAGPLVPAHWTVGPGVPGPNHTIGPERGLGITHRHTASPAIRADEPVTELYDQLVASVAPVTGEAADLLALIRTLSLDDYVTLMGHLRAEDPGDPTLFDCRWPVQHLRDILRRRHPLRASANDRCPPLPAERTYRASTCDAAGITPRVSSSRRAVRASWAGS